MSDVKEFKGHYVDWRKERFAIIEDHYNEDFFKGKTLLEVGSAYSDIGKYFHDRGAIVTCADARAEHVAIANKRYPEFPSIVVDLDKEWPFDHFDVIVHMGLLYHLADPESAIIKAVNSCNHLILETVCSDSSDPYYCLVSKEAGFDQAFNGIGSVPSPSFVERVLTEQQTKWKVVNDPKFTGTYHKYVWDITNTGKRFPRARRFWFVETKNSGVV